MKKLRLIPLILLGLGLLLTACKKKEIQGPKGDPGDPGAGGNASISSSTITMVSTNLWTLSSSPLMWRANVQTALITKAVVEKGSVSVYVQTSSGWRELPFLDKGVVTQFTFSEGLIQLQRFEVHSTLIDQPLAENYRFVTVAESARPEKSPDSHAVTNTQSKN